MVLPPMMVEAKGAPLHWSYLELPGYEVLSVCDDEVTLKFAERVLRLEPLLRQVLPARFQSKSSVPEKLILFNEKLNRVRSREVMEEMMRRAGAKMPPPEERSLFFRPDKALSPAWTKPKMQLLPNLRLRDADTTVVFASIVNSTETPMDFTYQTERITDLLACRSPALPSWLLEGMAGLYPQTQLKNDHVEFERGRWVSEEETRAIATDPDRPRILLPMQDLLAHRPRAPSETPAELDQIWRAQCALFIRWAIAESSGAKREALWRLVDRLENEPLSEQLFRECFGLGYSDARDRLSDYLPTAVTRAIVMQREKFSAAPALKIRTATDTEVARIVGDWERLEISYIKKNLPALTENYVEQARRRVMRLTKDGNDDRDLLAVKALIEVDAGNSAAAIADLESAATAGVIRPRIYLELAQLRYQTALAESTDGKFNPAQTARVLEPLFNADRLEPALLETYLLMTNVWGRSSEPPSPDNLARLNAGIRRFPQTSALVLRGIFFNLNAGLTATAGELVTKGWLNARDPEMRDRLKQVMDELNTWTAASK